MGIRDFFGNPASRGESNTDSGSQTPSQQGQETRYTPVVQNEHPMNDTEMLNMLNNEND